MWRDVSTASCQKNGSKYACCHITLDFSNSVQLKCSAFPFCWGMWGTVIWCLIPFLERKVRRSELRYSPLVYKGGNGHWMAFSSGKAIQRPYCGCGLLRICSFGNPETCVVACCKVFQKQCSTRPCHRRYVQSSFETKLSRYGNRCSVHPESTIHLSWSFTESVKA